VNITGIETKPLRIPYRVPYHWSQGVLEAAEVVLVCVHTDEGITGYGECMSTASADPITHLLRAAAPLFVGHRPFEIDRLMRSAYQFLFAARGNCSAPRFGALVLSGLDMALWDLAGKASGRAVHELLGGAVRDSIQYFGFPQGNTPEELSRDAKRLSDEGRDVIYVKIGRSESLDIEIVKNVRLSIGGKRLRVDANEAWDVLTARRMLEALAPFDVEFVEQPTKSDSLSVLQQVRDSSPIPIAADQLVFTPEEAFEVCRRGAADLIVLGLHETGGVGRFRKAAAIAEAAGINVCLHGLYETGVTTTAVNHVGATVSNLDDANQYMNDLLMEDIITSPDLRLQSGKLPVLCGPGFGFQLDWDAIGRAQAAYAAFHGQ